MLKDVELDQSVISSEMVISMEAKAIDYKIEVVEPVLYHNEKDIYMYGTVPEECYYTTQIMG